MFSREQRDDRRDYRDRNDRAGGARPPFQKFAPPARDQKQEIAKPVFPKGREPVVPKPVVAKAEVKLPKPVEPPPAVEAEEPEYDYQIEIPREDWSGSGVRIKTWKLKVEYDGTKYSGWQRQPNARTVQGELEKAACDLMGLKEVEIGGAGRTDAGVHARAQIAHLKVKQDIRIPTDRLMWGINDRLPSDVNVIEVIEARPEFHARHDAKSRAYVYQVSRRRTAFAKKQVWWVREDLDLVAMTRASRLLIGRHDFSCFSQKDPSKPDTSPIVVVDNVEITARDEDGLIVIRIEASHFLWKMVRRIVGVLVRLGKGEVSEEQFQQLLNGKADPALDVAAWTAPASGLFLENIRY
jgi:tRNA pseudouridine38-40 synthase